MAESRREASKTRCRQQILKASRRLFKEKGYEKTMIDDVADKAEISKATLYNYFPNKEGLLEGTMEEEIDAFMKYTNSIKDMGSIDERIRKALKFLILDSIAFIGVSRRILFLNACVESPMYGKANDVKEVFAVMTEQAKAEKIFKKEIPTKDIVDLLMGVYLNAQFQWADIEDISEEECGERIDRMLDLALNGCYTKSSL